METQQPDVLTWHRWFAIECNNQAWKLTELTQRTPDEVELMVNLAHAAAYHWSVVGTADNIAKAWGLLAQAHALAGNGGIAMNYAAKNLAYVVEHNGPDWEQAFAHAIMANAARSRNDHDLFSQHHRIATLLGEAIADPEDKEVFMKTMNNIVP